MKPRKIAALLLTIALCLPTVLSCAEENAGNTTEVSDSKADSSTGATEKSAHAMPEKDYDGYEFKFLVKEFDGNGYWGAQDIFAEQESADPINDAVYKRNRIVEDRYNIKIKEIRTFDVLGQGRTAIMSGTHEYDILMPSLSNLQSLLPSGLLMDVRSALPYLQLDQVWWDQRANQMLSLGKKQYSLIGDMTLMANDATWIIMFNKKVAEEYQLGNLYSYVKDGNWTFDTFAQLVKSVSKDLDSNSKFDENDQVGLLTDDGAKRILVYNTGEMVARKDADDLPYLSLNTERMITAAEKAFDILGDKEHVINAQTNLTHINNPWTNGINKMFKENKGLFYMLSLTIMHKMRDMESDFGVMPFPKLDSSQSEYYHTVQPDVSNSIVFPVTTPDPEMASIIIEDMCYEAQNTVRHAYFDVTVTNKTIRDDESAEMLDLIFSSRIYDLGYIFNWNGIGGLLGLVFPNAGNFVSRYEKLEPLAKTQMEQLIEQVNKIS